MHVGPPNLGSPLGDTAVQRLIESVIRSNSLFLRNSGRKAATHFSWNCSGLEGLSCCTGCN
ncbi:hypothetical protein FJ548_11730 [Mesorhizobium sp. B2-4-17]|nr:hypothetical protein FJ548_11730 [Mesorhizobium sp. B2-4-17]